MREKVIVELNRELRIIALLVVKALSCTSSALATIGGLAVVELRLRVTCLEVNLEELGKEVVVEWLASL